MGDVTPINAQTWVKSKPTEAAGVEARVGIVVPSGAMVHTRMALDLAHMMATLPHTDELEVFIVNPQSSLVQRGRWDGTRRALGARATHILFIDSDISFPNDGLMRLLAADRDIVGASYRRRFEGGTWVARELDGANMQLDDMSGLCHCASNGLGFCLIKREVFEAVPEPWFDVLFDYHKLDGADVPVWVSEDEHLFLTAWRRGFECWVDADLSQEIRHLGVHAF